MAQRKITHHLKEYAQRHGWDAVSMIPDGTQGHYPRHDDGDKGYVGDVRVNPPHGAEPEEANKHH